MKSLNIKQEEFVPEVKFNEETNVLEMYGQSYHEYTQEFFEPIFDWMKEFLSTEGRNVTLNFKMTYFNTASSKCFFDLIEMLQKYHDSGKGTAIVNWYYKSDDEDMLETGEDYISDSGWQGINLVSY